MNPSSVQQTGAVSPWRELRLSSSPAVEVAGEAAVIAVAVLIFEVAVFLQIGYGSLDRAFRQPKIGRDGLDPRPAFDLGGGHALEIHIDRFGSVWQAVVGIDGFKIADLTTPYVLT